MSGAASADPCNLRTSSGFCSSASGSYGPLSIPARNSGTMYGSVAYVIKSMTDMYTKLLTY